MTGLMKDFSKTECWRVRKLLKAKLETGEVEQTARGIYQIKPRLLAKLDGEINERKKGGTKMR
jgi:hypothetical protein